MKWAKRTAKAVAAAAVVLVIAVGLAAMWIVGQMPH